MAPRRSAIVVGIDGADPSIFFPLLRSGRLPFFQRYAAAWGETLSPDPIISPASWGSFMTGVRPGRHRLFGFQTQTRPGSVRVTSGADRGAGTLWQYLGEQGLRTAVLNVPMTYPPDAIEGVLISGIDTPSVHSEFVRPEPWRAKLRDAVPDYAIDVRSFGTSSDAASRRRLVADAAVVAAARGRAVRMLANAEDWDLLIVVFTEIDRLQHVLWLDHDPEHPLHASQADPTLRAAVVDAYVRLDAIVAEALAPLLGRGPLVTILSDHGAGPQHRMFSVAPVLRAAGLLALRNGNGGVRRRSIESLVALVRRQPRWVKDRIRQTFPAAQRLGYSALFCEGIDWDATLAYPAEIPGGVRLRPDLSGSDRAAACEAVTRVLRELRDPRSGGALIGRICRREELWPGPYVEEAPELFFDLVDPTVGVYGGLIRVDGEPLAPVTPEDQSGDHRRRGIFAAGGPGVRAQADVSVDICDFFPTLAAYLSGGCPNGLDGRARTDLLDLTVRERPWEAVATERTTLGADDEHAVRERLEGLGYL